MLPFSVPVVPVVTLPDAGEASRLSDALITGGFDSIEICLRNDQALPAIKSLADRTDICCGAGTILNEDQARAALDAGAKYLVSPGLHAGVVRIAQDAGVPILPGVCTPTEIVQALDLGLTLLKFFPAGVFGGTKTIVALSGVFPQVSFMPTGGVNADTIAAYMAVPSVVACGASWMVTHELLENKDYNKISVRCQQALAAIEA